MYTKNELIYGFNTWMDNYINDPESFEASFKSVDGHRDERNYGQKCVDYMAKLLD